MGEQETVQRERVTATSGDLLEVQIARLRELFALCIIIHCVPSDSEALKAFMEGRHLGQVDLAYKAGVS